MSDSQHTPGPWLLVKSDVYESGFRLDSGPGDKSIFDLRAYRLSNSQEECAANARLIVAAPDLLAALQSIHKAILQHKMEHSDFGIDIGTVAVEAIAKATET